MKLPLLLSILAFAIGFVGTGGAASAVDANANPAAERSGTLAISSVDTPTSIAARLTGTYSWNATHIKLKITQVEIIRQKFGAYPERKVLAFHVFVQRPNPASKRLDPIARSEKIPVNTTITHGQTVALDNVEIDIPLKGFSMAELEKMWLGVWVDDEHIGAVPAGGAAPRAPQVGVALALSSTCLNGEPRPQDPAPAR
jgi:hypothetical protein